VNAGKTSQRGIEAMLSYDVVNEEDFVSMFRIWTSYTYQHSQFKDYTVVDENFSGNRLTGMAPNIFSGGLDVTLAKSFSGNFTLNYVDEIPMNDANSVFADSYMLLGLRAGWKTTLEQSHRIEIFGGIDNALDKKYSLGNDINAFIPPGANPVAAGRYYNAAMPRNFYAGISVVLGSGK
jgi:iron complex outermembrane receptor protein